jgi:cyclophilin family peptidyl-prolyl cis-trans isomerase/HEAT repeat protein
MKKPILLLLLCYAIWQTACIPPSEEKMTDVKVDLKDPFFQRIHNMQDRAQLDSLYTFFRNPNPTYRYLAASAFGSVKGTDTVALLTAIDSLAILLKDEVVEVRTAAAYALGQIGKQKAEPLLLQSFERSDTAGIYKKSNRAILEAVGKCGTPETLKLLSTITTYQSKDTLLLEGQAYGIYRFMLRDITAKEGTNRMISLAANTTYPEPVRYVAAHYLARARNLSLDSLAAEPFISVINNERNPNIRMVLATALGKAKTLTAMNALLQLYNREEDYRVRVSILRALNNFPYEQVHTTALRALRDPRVPVATTASRYFIERGIAKDATSYWRLAKDTLFWQVAVDLYGAALRYLPVYQSEYRDAINYELRRRYVQAISPYHKAAILKALSEWGWNFRFIHREGMAAKHPAVTTAAVEALAYLCQPAQYNRFFGSSRAVAKEMAIYLQQAVQSGDPGRIAVAAGALRIPERNFRTQLDSLNFLQKTLTNLKLPKEIETYNEVQQTLDFFAGRTFQARKPEFNHPIDWTVFNNLSPEPKVILRTKRGDLTIRLLPDIAPGSVVNFVKLAKDGFFDGKNFHRVVPNFVIQGGCPRGDGYGSLDYSIRSELVQVYYDREGYVGMASAGPHTEGTQFFITHSPTPHLDGNYTIFGRVTEGMNVVHELIIGEVIEKVLIQ